MKVKKKKTRDAGLMNMKKKERGNDANKKMERFITTTKKKVPDGMETKEAKTTTKDT